MKTTTSLLMILLMLAGSQFTMQAQRRVEENNRITATPRVTETNRPNQQTTKKAEIRVQSETRNNQGNTRIDIKSTRGQQTTSANIRFETNRRIVANRPSQIREFKHACSYCNGKGFSLTIFGSRHNCSHCSGVGFRILREMYMGSMAQSGYYSIRELAQIETNQLDAVLNLTRRQWDRIYSINYSYLNKRERNRYYSESKWEQSINRELNYRQRLEYAYYIDEIRHDQYASDYNY